MKQKITNMFELTKINTIKFNTYKYTLYLLIKLNLITINQKNNLLSNYLDKLITMWIRTRMDNINEQTN